jgi:hypothetical protein
VLRHWTQATLTAILIPAWLASEWSVRVAENRTWHEAPLAVGLCTLSLAYLTARRDAEDSPLRKALAWCGGLALLPSAAFLIADFRTDLPPGRDVALGWAIAAAGPLAVAILLRGRGSLWNAGAITWAALVTLVHAPSQQHERIAVDALYATGAAGLAAWGVVEARTERIGLGLLFLGGGWLLERMRRRLIARIRVEAA